MIRLVSLLVIFLTLKISESNVAISAVPENIEVGLATRLNITCSVPHDQPASVTALRLSHRTSDDQHFTELASIDRLGHITSHDPHVANITGHIVDKGAAFLTLQWVYPTSVQSGMYVCNVSMLVTSPHIHTSHETRNVTVNKSKPDFLKVIQELRSVRDYFDKQLKIEAAKWTNRLQLFTDTYFEELSAIGRKSYLLSKQKNVIAMQAEIMCHLVGGYLAEINQTDVVQIQTQLNSSSSYDADIVLIGGNDPELTGHWVYLRNNRPMNRLASLNATQGEDCLALDASQSYEYTTVPCSYPNIRGNSTFLCERPS